MIKVFVGYDTRDVEAWKTCEYSLNLHCSQEIQVIPIGSSTLNCYSRKPDALASTEFTYARFFVPYLCNYTGTAIFMDSDFLLLSDISELLTLFDPKYAVQVVKHNYNPASKTKMGGKSQSNYPRKNWSSMIMWNCAHPKHQSLNLDMLNTAGGDVLHQFKWLHDDDIGDLPLAWNWLVGWYKENDSMSPKALHFTEGGPWIDEYKECEYADIWRTYNSRMHK